MSSQEYVVSGKDEFSVSELVIALKKSKTQVPAHVEHALGSENNTAVATQADWEKFWTAVNKVDAPVTSLVEASEDNQVKVSPGTVSAAITAAISIAEKLWKIFSGWVDKSGRSEWTKKLVSDAYNNDSRYNYIVVCTKHSVNFDGVQDRDWSVRSYNYKLKVGSIGYNLYACRGGVFSLKGDGGYLNWAYISRVVSADPDSKRPRNVVFRGA